MDINSQKDIWTWRDTLKRIQYVDNIIAQIVKDALTINTFLLTIFAALVAFKSFIGGQIIVFLVSAIVISSIGTILNYFMARSLARQEYYRQWYFALFPAKLPLNPPENWLPNECNENVGLIYSYKTILGLKKNNNLLEKKKGKILNEYNMDIRLEIKNAYESASNRIPICKIGMKSSGYCESWFKVFGCLSILFFILFFITVIILLLLKI